MRKYILLPIIILFLSCQKDVELDIEELPPSLTIEARISNESNQTAVKLTMSKGLYEISSIYETITDAQVSITDEQGNVIQLNPNTENVYVTNHNFTPGKTYQLDVVKGDKHATASATMPAAVPINDFLLVEENGDTYIDVYFDDDPNQEDYYIFNLVSIEYGYENNRVIKRDDAYYDRTQHKLKIENGFLISANSTYSVEIFHINKLIYDYFNTLDDIQDAGFGVTPFTTSVPGNPNTNVTNGIGFFSAESYSFLEKTSLSKP